MSVNSHQSGAITQALTIIEQSQGVIVVSPDDKASFTGVLKTFFDLIPEKGLTNKIILPIVNGGSIALLLTLEQSFNPLFSVLNSHEIVMVSISLILNLRIRIKI
ncbi:NAD(P)H-dependent oxidoreductase [Niallia oryzisoli]|uniref:NAD(P)H-dependent oxidoreductase n=1 Tax=Niallia oryzisoli TaxID=1737571 RepID=A0ABZ2CA04_9BACI